MSMSTAEPSFDADAARIKAQARDWLLRIAGEQGADTDAVEECRRWRAADARHERAFQLARLAWSAMGQSEMAKSNAWRTPSPASDDAHRPKGSLWARIPPARRAIAASLLVLVAGSLVTLGTLRGSASSPTANITTRVAQIREIELQDGSHLSVGPKTNVQVRFDAGERRVTLADGQAFFEVAHDRDRPFFVTAGNTEIRVTGTKFDVWRHGDDVRVAVLEGRVELRKTPRVSFLRFRKPEAVLVAGQVVQHPDAGEFTAPGPVGADVPGGWRSGRLYYAGTPLAEVIADANRYSTMPIRLAGGGVGDVLVTASFRTDAVDRFVESLPSSLPVTVRREPNGEMLVSGQ